MKNLLLAFTLIAPLFFQGPEKGASTLFTISGNVSSTMSYTKGTPPTQADIELYYTAHPERNIAVVLKSGKAGNQEAKILAQTLTDSLGNYSFQVPPGDYCVVLQARIDYQRPQNLRPYVTFDAECYEAWIKGCDREIEVIDRDISKMDIGINYGGFDNGPCTRYNGPLPN